MQFLLMHAGSVKVVTIYNGNLLNIIMSNELHFTGVHI